MPGKKDSEYDTLEQFRKYVSADLSDKRTKAAISLKRIRQGLQNNDNAALQEILINVISINLHVEKRMTDQLMQDNALTDDEGNLLPAISKDLLKLRENTLKYLKMLQSMQNKNNTSKDSMWDLIDD